jgi:phage-related protein
VNIPEGAHPRMRVVFFREESGPVPVLDWFDHLPDRAVAKCRGKIELLRTHGHQLKRPHAAYLGDGLYELRTRMGSVNYRMLYFFHDRAAVVLAHGFEKKQARVPDRDLRLADRRRRVFEDDPAAHTFVES